jgi:hypothetical protein
VVSSNAYYKSMLPISLGVWSRRGHALTAHFCFELAGRSADVCV